MLAIGAVCPAARAQTNEWAWMAGDSAIPSRSVCGTGWYGELGASEDYYIPGGRYGASSWTDASGHLWLFGGWGCAESEGVLNDLWEFNPSTVQWTWMNGSDEGDYPPVYSPGVYGTLGEPAAGNTPGRRYFATNWTDSKGNFWLFGGDPNAAMGYFNDLWKTSPPQNEWAWMGGSRVPAKTGVYGSLGTAAHGNVPVGTVGASSWTDSKGHLWLFGGTGYDASGNLASLNDLWEFNPATSEWAWMGGSKTITNPGSWCGLADGCGQAGVYGTLGTPAAGNIPGGRTSAASWTDLSGHFWLFGGFLTYSSTSLFPPYSFNDLWEFNPATNEWAWMGGSSTVGSSGGSPGVYGKLGTAAVGNIPGSRGEAATWTDSEGNLWLEGGFGYDAASKYGAPTYGALNDLWKFSPTTREWAWMGGSSTVGNNDAQPGVYGTLSLPGAGNIPGGRESGAAWTDSKGNFWLFGGSGVDANGNDGYLNDFWRYQLFPVGMPPVITTQPVSQIVPVGSNATFTVAASDTSTLAYAWQYRDGSTWKVFDGDTLDGSLYFYGTKLSDNGLILRAVVTDRNGLSTASQATKLTLSPVITTYPSFLTIPIGSRATFSVVAEGEPTLKYKWEYQNWANPAAPVWDAFVEGTGYTTATMTTFPTTLADEGLELRVVVTDGNGLTVTSLGVVLSLKAAIAKQPTSQTVVDGKSAVFSVVAAGIGALTYQWQYLDGATWKAFTAGTGYDTATLTTFATSASKNGLQLRAVVNDGADDTLTSNTVKLTVAPAIKTQPTSQTVALGGSATFNVVAEGVATLTYQWQYASGSTWKPFTAGTGYTTAKLTTAATTAASNGMRLRVVATDGDGLTAKSGVAVLTVSSGGSE